MIRPGNDPAWCTGIRHEDFGPGAHSSRHLSAGALSREGGRGEVIAWLVRNGDGPTMVALNAADATSSTVEITVAEAVRLRDHLDRLLGWAGSGSLR